jgi:hypothetical protein
MRAPARPIRASNTQSGATTTAIVQSGGVVASRRHASFSQSGSGGGSNPGMTPHPSRYDCRAPALGLQHRDGLLQSASQLSAARQQPASSRAAKLPPALRHYSVHRIETASLLRAALLYLCNFEH